MAPDDPASLLPEPAATPPPELPRVLRPGYRLFHRALATPGRRAFYVRAVRAIMVLGMVALVTAVILPELTNTAQPAPDPLTGVWTLRLSAYNSSAIAGLVDGDDVVAGNFTVLSPPGTAVLFDTLPPGNGTWGDRLGQAIYALSGLFFFYDLSFTEIYTAWYTFVWTNPYNATVEVYVALNYLSSAPPA